MAAAEASGCEIVLPADAMVTREFREGAESTVVPVAQVPANGMILDLGPETVARIEAALAASRTLVWNGPLGAFEIAPFDRATARHRPAPPPGLPRRGRCSPSPAGAIPSRRSRQPACSAPSATCRPPAAPSSNGWRERRSPESRRWRPGTPRERPAAGDRRARSRPGGGRAQGGGGGRGRGDALVGARRRGLCGDSASCVRSSSRPARRCPRPATTW